MDTDYSYDMDHYVNPDISHGAVSPLEQPLSGHMFADVKTQREDGCMGGAKARIETRCQQIETICQQDEKICQLGQGLVNRQAYINAKVRVENTGKHFTERVFVDPGNLLLSLIHI